MKKIIAIASILFFAGPVFAAQKTITVGTSETTASLDTNFGNAEDNFTDLYGQAATKWVTSKAYTANNQMVAHGGHVFVCTSNHTSGATTEPGTGASWSTVWKYHGSDLYAAALTSDQNYVTDAQLVVIGNTSGTNTGNQTGANVAFADTDNLFTATMIGPAIEEFNDSINSGAPNGTGAKVHWSQILGMPSVFADGTDDGAAGEGISHATSDGNYYASKDGAWASLTGLYAAALGADDNYVTDAQVTLLGNTSGTNSGDNATNSQYSGLITSKTANYFFAAPNGSAGTPSFRAMVAADVPTLNQNTSGTAAGLSGTPNITVGTISAGSAGFGVDADGDVTAKSVNITKVSGTAGDIGLAEANSTDTHGAGWRGPASITGDGAYRGQFANAGPSEAVIQVWGASTSGTGTAADPYVHPVPFITLGPLFEIAGSAITFKSTAAPNVASISFGADPALNAGGGPRLGNNMAIYWKAASGDNIPIAVDSSDILQMGQNASGINLNSAPVTGAVIDSQASNNTVKGLSYISLNMPHSYGSLVTLNASTAVPNNGRAIFTGDGAAANNWIEWIITVPPDIDTAVDLTADFKFILGDADTADHDYIISMVPIANSEQSAASLGTPINLAYTPDASGASGDRETASGTLTGWAAALAGEAGNSWRIRVARDGDDGTNDASTATSVSGTLTIRYGFTQ